VNIRPSTLVWVFVLALAFLGLYMVKFEVQSVREQVADATHQLEVERDALHVISAEWAYLSRPERLRSLAAKHLKMAPVQTPQLVAMDSLPERADATRFAAVSEQGLMQPVSANAFAAPVGGVQDAE
jgi:hypothetical protein